MAGTTLVKSTPPQMKAPAHPDVVRGLEVHRQGKAAEAEALYRRALATSPGNFDAQALLGVLLAERGRAEEGLKLLEAAAAARPHSLNTQRNIGVIRLLQQDPINALTAFEAALRAAPADIEALRGKARALWQLKRYGEAEICLRKTVAHSPQPAADLTDLGALLADQDKHKEGLEVLARAAKLNPAAAAVHYHASRCYRGLHDFEKALQALEVAKPLTPKAPAVRLALAEVHRALNNSQAALQQIEECLSLAPTDSTCLALKASLLLDLGRGPEAAILYRKLARMPRHRASALLELAQSKTLSSEDPDTQLILADTDEPPSAGDRILLSFARGKVREDLGHHDQAFAHYADARRQRAATAPKETRASPNDIARAFSGARFANGGGSGSELPVFIVGMPRSGTSLVEQMIAAHPQAAGAGELYDMLAIGQKLGLLRRDAPAVREAFSRIDTRTAEACAARYLGSLRRAGGSPLRIADKMPHNFIMLGLIARLLPKARIVHVKREPADTCFSCFANNLPDYHRYANDLGSLGRYYVDYDSLMRQWTKSLPLAIHEVEYEKLIAGPERELRNLLSFLGLEWNERCLRFFETGGTVSTFSRGQVRQPLYSRSIGRWRNFEAHLAPLFAALGELAPKALSKGSNSSR